MAQSLGHQALVKVSFFVLWDKAKFSAYKMQVTVILSVESYKEEKRIRKCWTADALEGAESSCCLMSSLHRFTVYLIPVDYHHLKYYSTGQAKTCFPASSVLLLS